MLFLWQKQRTGGAENNADLAAIAGCLIYQEAADGQPQGIDMTNRHTGPAFGAERRFKDKHGRSLTPAKRQFNSNFREKVMID
jgi:hypothetical protein